VSPVLRALRERLGATPAERDEERLRLFCEGRPGVTRIGELVPRQPMTAVGEVVNLRIVPRPTTVWLDATISDGSGKLIIRWSGRRNVPGVRLGRRLVCSGRAGATGPGGRLLVYNPRYELL
jgi:hypothetical protein